MPHRQLKMCLQCENTYYETIILLWVQNVHNSLQKNFEMFVKKYSRFQKKNHHNFCMFPAPYSEGFALYGKILLHISKHPKIVMIFFFEIWNIFWQIFQNFFGENYGHFGLTTRWWSHNKYLHISQAHSKLPMGHFLGTFRQFFQKFWMKPSNFVFERFNELNWF